MKGERLSWKEQWVLSEVIWSAFDFSEPSEHFPAIIYLLYASTFNTPDAPREMWEDLFMWKWCHVMFEMKAVCKGNDSLVSVCQTSKQYMKGRYGCLTLFTSPNTTKKLQKQKKKRDGNTKRHAFSLRKHLLWKLKCLHLFCCCTFLCFFNLSTVFYSESVWFGPGCGIVIER